MLEQGGKGMWGKRLFLGKACPTIELAGFQRLADLQRRVNCSPVAVLLVLIGVAGGIHVLWSLRLGVEAMPQSLLVGYGTFMASYLGLLAYYHWYRFPRLRCPQCGERMQANLADLDDASRPKLLSTVELSGRYYLRPYDEDDRRPWVRLMRLVRACAGCKTFIECSHLHFETCTADELALLEQRQWPMLAQGFSHVPHRSK
jgi:hypothetical protein